MPVTFRAHRSVVRSIAILSGDQNFLSRGWIPWLLRNVPEPRRRRVALEVLALSPHYFDAGSAGEAVSRSDWLEAESERNRLSREELANSLLSRYVRPHDKVLDYGCGPGFLARAVAGIASEVAACDISRGAIACARVLNPAPNLRYISLLDQKLPSSSYDVIYSFAVIQHVTDEVLSSILSIWLEVMKPGATAIAHVVLEGDAPSWRTEKAWTEDKSLRGRLRWRYGLHCFIRSERSLRGMLERKGFVGVTIQPVSDIAKLSSGDDIAGQHLCVFKKPLSVGGESA